MQVSQRRLGEQGELLNLGLLLRIARTVRLLVDNGRPLNKALHDVAYAFALTKKDVAILIKHLGA